MDALTQAEVFALIGELNGFIEKWDPRLVTQEREYQAKRTRIIAENNAEKTRREKAYKQECETLSRQSAKMIEDAQKILEDVDQMDQQLMSSDKYYSKTKTRKEAELAGVESQAYRNYTALIRRLIFWLGSLQNRRIPLSSRRDSPRSLRMTIPLPHCWLKCRLLLRMWLRQNRKM